MATAWVDGRSIGLTKSMVEGGSTTRVRLSSALWRERCSSMLMSIVVASIQQIDCKVFGEFYTTDCLAAMMVEQVLDEH